MDEAGTPKQRMKSIEYLASIDVSKEKNQRSLKSIDIGTKTKIFFLQGDVLEETKLKFRQECLSFYVTAATLLQKNLPFTALVIRDAQFLHPEKRNDPASLTAVSKLTLVIADVLQSTIGDNVLPKVFHTQPTLKTEEICDLVRSQRKLYQAECVPEEFYVEHVEESNKGKVQDSYWRRVEEKFGLGITASDKEERQMKRIDDYWCQIGQLKDE